MIIVTFRLKGGAGSGNFGHSGRPGKIGGSSGGGVGSGGSASTSSDNSKNSVEAGKQAIMQRFQSLGAKNITFKKNDDGSFDVWAQSKGSKKPTFSGNRVMPDGKVYLVKNGKPTMRII